jgi:hypothetical protein
MAFAAGASLKMPPPNTTVMHQGIRNRTVNNAIAIIDPSYNPGEGLSVRQILTCA